MSKLYEAIKKIEEKEKIKAELPDFVQRKRKPPYLLVIVSTLFVALVVFSGLYFTNRLENIRKSSSLKRERLGVVKKERLTEKGRVEKKAFLEKSGVKVKNEVPVKELVAKRETKVVSVAKEVAIKSESKDVNFKSQKRAREGKTGTASGKNIVIKNREREITKVERPENNFSMKELSKDQTAVLLKKANSGDFFESVKAYKKLIKLYPNNISLYNNLAVLFMDKGLYWKAIEVLKKGLSVKDDSTLKLNLAICYIKLGKIKRAKRIVNTIPLNSKDSKEIEKLNRYLSNLK